MQKLFLVFLFLGSFNISFAAYWDGSVSEPVNTRQIDGKIFFVITKAQELAWFAMQVNSGQTKINAVLDADIEFTDSIASFHDIDTNLAKLWTPIGKSSDYMFEGIFDGKNFSIEGLYVKLVDVCGLFGWIGKDGNIKNVTIKHSNMSAKYHLGSIAGYNLGSISNCRNEMSLVGFQDSTRVNASDSLYYVGGIVGSNWGNINGCTNNGYVGGSKIISVGCIAGINAGVVKNCITLHGLYISPYTYGFFIYVGGIVGYNSGVIDSCETNTETDRFSISADGWRSSDPYQGNSGSSYVGGITAYSTGVVANSVNNFIVENGNRFEFGYMGGIAGYNSGDIYNSSNKGEINNSGYANTIYRNTYAFTGGIAGDNRGKIYGCFNSGRIYSYSWATYTKAKELAYTGGIAGNNFGSVVASTNEGRVLGRGSSSYSGGIAGLNSGALAKVSSSYSSIDTVSGPACGGGIIGKNMDSASAMNSYFNSTVDSLDLDAIGCEYASSENVKGVTDLEFQDMIAGGIPAQVISHPLRLFIHSRKLYVESANLGDPLVLYDLQGKRLFQNKIKSLLQEFQLPHNGAYIVRVGKITQKVIVK